jgi:hypothetical protein
MTISLIPLIVFVIGLILFVLPVGPKANRVGEILMLAGALGFTLSGGHNLTIR